MLFHLLTFKQDAIEKVNASKEKELKVVNTYHTKVIKKILKEKSKECVSKVMASEKRKTKENTILLAGHKDEMFKLVNSHEKELHVRTIVLCVPLPCLGLTYRVSN